MSSTNNVSQPGVAELVELSALQAAPSGPALLGNLRLLDGVQVKLDLMVGRIDTTVGELMSLQEAAVLKTDRLADAPLDLLLNGAVVARGQLVVVDDCFGVRITEIAKAE